MKLASQVEAVSAAGELSPSLTPDLCVCGGGGGGGGGWREGGNLVAGKGKQPLHCPLPPHPLEVEKARCFARMAAIIYPSAIIPSKCPF